MVVPTATELPRQQYSIRVGSERIRALQEHWLRNYSCIEARTSQRKRFPPRDPFARPEIQHSMNGYGEGEETG
jgi:hypothetical protein